MKKGLLGQLLKVNKNNRNVSSLSEFLSSPFSPTKPAVAMVLTIPMAMGNTSLPLAARENTSLALKKQSFCWKISFRHCLKNFFLYRELFLF